MWLRVTCCATQFENRSRYSARHRFCSIWFYSFGALVKAGRLFTASLHNQPMYSKMCSIDIFCNLRLVGCNLTGGLFGRRFGGLRGTWEVGDGRHRQNTGLQKLFGRKTYHSRTTLGGYGIVFFFIYTCDCISMVATEMYEGGLIWKLIGGRRVMGRGKGKAEDEFELCNMVYCVVLIIRIQISSVCFLEALVFPFCSAVSSS